MLPFIRVHEVTKRVLNHFILGKDVCETDVEGSKSISGQSFRRELVHVGVFKHRENQLWKVSLLNDLKFVLFT